MHTFHLLRRKGVPSLMMHSAQHTSGQIHIQGFTLLPVRSKPSRICLLLCCPIIQNSSNNPHHGE